MTSTETKVGELTVEGRLVAEWIIKVGVILKLLTVTPVDMHEWMRGLKREAERRLADIPNVTSRSQAELAGSSEDLDRVFFVKGDGMTDDTMALQRVLNAGSSEGGDREGRQCIYTQADLEEACCKAAEFARRETRTEALEAAAQAINVGNLAPKEYGHPQKYRDGYRAALIEAESIIRALNEGHTGQGEGE